MRELSDGTLLKVTDERGHLVFVYSDYLVGAYEMTPEGGGTTVVLELNRPLTGYGYSYVLLERPSGEAVREYLDANCVDLTAPETL